MAESMTGYGRGEQIANGLRFLIEIRSVNNRYGDVQIRGPRSVLFLEAKIKERILHRLTRGKMDVFITLENSQSSAQDIQVDKGLASAYSQALCDIADITGRSNSADAYIIARFPDVVKQNAAQIPPEELENLLFSVLDDALSEISEMRVTEGQKLSDDITLKIDTLLSLRENLAKRAPLILEEYRNRLSDRMQELLASMSDVFYDEGRKEAELAIFADKSCVDEELVRMESHFNQLRTTLNESGAVGKKIDFLLQEINREVNTVGSKSSDLQMTDTVLKMKTELEKIREQVQNLV